MATVFETLYSVDVSEHIEKKGNLNYLSWAWAWAETKKAFPGASFRIYEDINGMNYHTDGKTAWVKVGVTINDIEMLEHLPIMNNYNRSIPLEKISSFDVNTAIKRCLAKACAMHGLGLFIYAGEDVPEIEETPETNADASKIENSKTSSNKSNNKKSAQNSKKTAKADFKKEEQKKEAQPQQEQDKSIPTPVSADTLKKLRVRLKETNVTENYIKEHYKISSLTKLSENFAQQLIALAEGKIERMKKEALEQAKATLDGENVGDWLNG